MPTGHGFSFFGHGKVMENQSWKRGGTLNFIQKYMQLLGVSFNVAFV